MDNPLPRRAAENPTQYNIEAIAKLESYNSFKCPYASAARSSCCPVSVST
jgi:hypothetical protein